MRIFIWRRRKNGKLQSVWSVFLLFLNELNSLCVHCTHFVHFRIFKMRMHWGYKLSNILTSAPGNYFSGLWECAKCKYLNVSISIRSRIFSKFILLSFADDKKALVFFCSNLRLPSLLFLLNAPFFVLILLYFCYLIFILCSFFSN